MTPNVWRMVLLVIGALLVMVGVLIVALVRLQDDPPLQPVPHNSRVVQVYATVGEESGCR